MDLNVAMFIKMEILNNFTGSNFELSFNQEEKECKHKRFPVEIGETDSDKVIDLLI